MNFWHHMTSRLETRNNNGSIEIRRLYWYEKKKEMKCKKTFFDDERTVESYCYKSIMYDKMSHVIQCTIFLLRFKLRKHIFVHILVKHNRLSLKEKWNDSHGFVYSNYSKYLECTWHRHQNVKVNLLTTREISLSNTKLFSF